MNGYIKNDKSALNYRLTVMSFLCLLLLIVPVILIIIAHNLSAFAGLIYIICSIFILVIITFTIINAYISYKIYCYRIDDKGIEIIRGFIYKKHIYQPRNKIKQIIKINKKIIYKNLCDIIFVNDAYNVIIRNITLEKADEILKENFEGVYYNEGV